MQRLVGILALATLNVLTASATAQRGPGGQNWEDGPRGKGPGWAGKGPWGKDGPDAVRKLQTEIESLKAQLTEIEARLARVKQSESRMSGGFGGPRAKGPGKKDEDGLRRHGPGERFGSDGPHHPGMRGGFGPHRGPMDGQFGPHSRGFGPPRPGMHDGFGPHHHYGMHGGFPGSRSGPGSSIERKVDHIQEELDELRREIRGSRW